jgi:hypothetical protein
VDHKIDVGTKEPLDSLKMTLETKFNIMDRNMNVSNKSLDALNKTLDEIASMKRHQAKIIMAAIWNA